MKTLYISDLDGTLLNSKASLSDDTRETINRLVEQGMFFTYATARSAISSKNVTEGLNLKLPIIIYNGTFIMDTQSGEYLISNYFGDEVREILDDLMAHDIYPIVYSHRKDEEKFTYMPERASRGVMAHIHHRKGDKRTHPVETVDQMYEGDIFCLNCIDEPEKLSVIYEKYKERLHCVYYMDIYTKEWWLEMIPKTASKAGAALMLKEYLACDRLVVFGDQKNDMDLFKVADECYAVDNAVDELKALATDIIKANDEDGVAQWLTQNSNLKGAFTMTNNITINTHSSIRLDLGDIIYFDPFEIKEEVHDADMIFVTHDHFDHFSPDDIAKITKEDTLIIAPESTKENVLKNSCIKEENCIFVVPGKNYEIEGLLVEVVPSYNEGKQFHTKEMEWCGYIVTADEVSYYIAGDTDVVPEICEVKCDVAMIPVGGTYTMTHEEALEFAKKANASVIIPTHYGTLAGEKTAGPDFKELCARECPDVQVELKLQA